MADQNVTVRLAADDSRLAAGFARGKREAQSFANSIKGIAATLGAGMMVKKVVADSAQLSREQQKLQVAVGGTSQEMNAWRSEMMANQAATSTLVEDQLELSKALQAAGLGMKEIRAVLGPASETMAVAEANAKSLGQALGVAREKFNIDLKNPEAVRKALDQMVVAGRLGNAELENLPDIFARVGGNAKAANLGFSETLALVESLSRAEANPERLATLADTDGARLPWVWIMEILLSEIEAGRYEHPYCWDVLHADDGQPHVCLCLRAPHVMDHISTAPHLRQKYDALPIKTGRVFKRQLLESGVTLDDDIERTVRGRRSAHMTAISLERLERLGLYATPTLPNSAEGVKCG